MNMKLIGKNEASCSWSIDAEPGEDVDAILRQTCPLADGWKWLQRDGGRISYKDRIGRLRADAYCHAVMAERSKDPKSDMSVPAWEPTP